MINLQDRIGKRIGLFGGTFDPPHWGHIRTAQGAADELKLNQIAFLPAFHPPHKLDQPCTSFELRCRMLELCLPLDPRFRSCLVEEKENLPGTTFETVQKLRELGYAADRCKLIWLMGSDSLLDLGNWHRPNDLLNSVQVAVMPRPGYPIQRAQSRYLKRVRLLKTPLIDISAQEIRSHHFKLEESVPPDVAKFILDSHLYGYERSEFDK